MAHVHVTSASAPGLVGLSPLAFKYAVVGAVLRAGCGVFYADVTTTWADGPHAFGYLARDTDLEAATGASGRSMLMHGRVVSVDDAQMGWSRYAQSLAISGLSPNLFYAAATSESAALMAFLRQTHARPVEEDAPGPEGTARDEMYELTKEAFAPAHDGKRSAGGSYPILPNPTRSYPILPNPTQ